MAPTRAPRARQARGRLATLALLLVAGCTGGNGPPLAEADPTLPGQTSATPATSGPVAAFPGFDLAIRDGTFWDFVYDYSHSSFAQGSGGSTSTASGSFRVILGDESTIAGITAYRLHVLFTEGDEPPFDVTRWQYLAVDGNRLLGSEDGATLQVVFDAETGTQPGGGFFASFAASELLVASAGRLSNDYLDQEAVVLSASFEEARCEYFESVGTVCAGDRDTSRHERDYFQPGVGPLGYYYSFSFSDCGGGFCSGSSTTTNVALSSYSLEGEGPYVAVEEPTVTTDGYRVVVDDTATIAVEVPAGWVDTVTEPVTDAASAALMPTIMAAPALDGFSGSFAGPGLVFQGLPVSGEPPEDFETLLAEVAAADAAVCSTAYIEFYEEPGFRGGQQVLVNCGGMGTGLEWIVGYLEGRTDFLVVAGFQWVTDTDFAHRDRVVSSLRYAD